MTCLEGVISQQLILLPFHQTNPTSLPFRVTHVLLTGTMCRTFKVLDLTVNRPAGELTEQQKWDVVREGVETSFDPSWVQDASNSERLDWWVKRMTVNRPMRTLSEFDRLFSTLRHSALL